MKDLSVHFLWLVLLFLPAFVSNGVPVIAQNIPFIKRFSTPVCEKHLGSHKTYRGFLTGVFSGGLIGIGLFYTPFFEFSFFQSTLLGLSLGFGALFGDAVESFVKRKIGKKPGEAWPVWDGIDYILGALLFVLPWYIPTWYDIVFLLLFAPFLSLISNTVAYFLGWKKVWY